MSTYAAECSMRPAARDEEIMRWTLQKLSDEECLTPDEKDELAKILGHERYGTCSLMVQTAFLRWAPGSVEQQQNGCQRVGVDVMDSGCSPVMLPCTVLQSQTSRCLRAALDIVSPALSFASLVAMARHVHVLFLALGKDSASANSSLARDLAGELPPNVLLWHGFCQVHLLALVLRTVLEAYPLYNSLYCLSKLVRLHTYHEKFIRPRLPFVTQCFVVAMLRLRQFCV
jgi:hypothetical protein